jgi:membrane protease YdiL (CAAX protease family)
MPYAAFEILVAPARAQSEPWRLVVAVLAIVAGYLALNLAYFGGLQQVLGAEGWRLLGSEMANGETPRAVLLMLFNFATLLVSMTVVIFAFYGRGILSFVGPLPLALRDFTRVLAHLAVLNLVLWVMPWPGSVAPQPNTDIVTWIGWLPLALAAILLQSATEELGFRGFLQAQIGARFSSPLMWMVLPSVLFALLHADPQTFGSNTWIVMLWAGVFGVLAADLTARAGNLGPAMALHLMNNVSAMLVFALAGHWDGLALQVLPVDPADTAAFRPLILLEGAAMFVSWLAARLAIRR